MATLPSRLALGVAFAAVLGGIGAAQQGVPNATGWSASNYNESANRYSRSIRSMRPMSPRFRRRGAFILSRRLYRPLKTDEAIPVVMGNTMYVASPMALSTRWTRPRRREMEVPASQQRRTVQARVAYWAGGNGAPASIIFGGASGGMYSINASNGP